MAQGSWLAGVSGHRGDPVVLVGQEVLGTSPGVCRSAPPCMPQSRDIPPHARSHMQGQPGH